MSSRFRGFPEEGIRFLENLKKNNNRPWFNARKDVYERSIRRPLDAFVLTLAREFEAFAPEILANPKTSRYRIYRDTRFSPDKTPYKTHVAVGFPRRGLARHQGAGLYVHIAPAELFVGGGLYRPAPSDLFAVREHIAKHHQALRRIARQSTFRKLFGEIHGETLRRIPRGFPKDHPAEDLLRHKQFLAARQLDPEITTTPKLQAEVVRTFKALLPMIRFLNAPLEGTSVGQPR